MPRATTTQFQSAVHDVLAELRRGELVTYAWVAREAGSAGAARAVGRYLATASDAPNWWRVVAADGRLVAPSAAEQRRAFARKATPSSTDVCSSTRVRVARRTADHHRVRTATSSTSADGLTSSTK